MNATQNDQLKIITRFVMAHDRLQEVDRLGALHPDHWMQGLYYAAWTWALIHMNDALKAAEALGERCTITENVTPPGIDLTELIRRARNVACHIGTDERWYQDDGVRGRLAWIFISGGQVADTIISGDLVDRCEFDDDWLMRIGTVRLYLHRNIDVAMQWLFEFIRRRDEFLGWRD